MHMYINVPWLFWIVLPDGYPRYNIVINVYVYKNAIKLGVTRIMHDYPNERVNSHIL